MPIVTITVLLRLSNTLMSAPPRPAPPAPTEAPVIFYRSVGAATDDGWLGAQRRREESFTELVEQQRQAFSAKLSELSRREAQLLRLEQRLADKETHLLEREKRLATYEKDAAASAIKRVQEAVKGGSVLSQAAQRAEPEHGGLSWQARLDLAHKKIGN